MDEFIGIHLDLNIIPLVIFIGCRFHPLYVDVVELIFYIETEPLSATSTRTANFPVRILMSFKYDTKLPIRLGNED